MEVLDNTFEPFVSRKRPLDDVDDCELEDFGKPRIIVPNFPPPKIRMGVQVVRDFPPGCGTSLERRPNLDNQNLCKNMTSNNIKNLKGSTTFKNVEHKCYNPKKLEQTKLISRPSGKVKLLELLCSKEVCTPIPKVTITVRITSNRNSKLMISHGQEKSLESPQGVVQREKINEVIVSREKVKREMIKKVIDMFNDLYCQKSLEDTSMHWKTAQSEVAKMVQQKLKWMDPAKVLGPICGIRIGDTFRFRLQLHMIGLHRQPECGIDYTKINEKNLAISIVDSHRYSNESGSDGMLIYSGHGGFGSWVSDVPVKDQKLKKGNLALKNSMDEKNPIRVIRKIVVGEKNEVFLYDGLYNVNRCTEKRNNEGKIEFRFQLIRLPGQPKSFT